MEQGTIIRSIGDYVLRRVNEEDIPSVVSVNLVTLPEHYSDFFYYELLRNFPEGFIVAEKGGKIVGYIMCRIEYGFSFFKFNIVRKGHIVSIAVLAEHRRKGLGEAMMLEAMEAMKKRGCEEAFLEVRVSNHPAISLYKKLGFKEVRRIPFYYRDGEEALVMAKPL